MLLTVTVCVFKGDKYFLIQLSEWGENPVSIFDVIYSIHAPDQTPIKRKFKIFSSFTVFVGSVPSFLRGGNHGSSRPTFI